MQQIHKVYMVILSVIALGVVYFIAGLIHFGFIPPTLDDLRYCIETEQKIRKVEVIDIVKEKDKEPMYRLEIELYSSPVIIPESVYMEYIGEGNNAITVTAETLSIYYGYDYSGYNKIFPCYETDFSKKDGYFKCIYISSVVFPWEDVETYWTDERIIKKAEDLIANKHQALNRRTEVPENAKKFK